MRHHVFLSLSAASLVLCLAAVLVAEDASTSNSSGGGHVIVAPDQIKWSPGPPSLPAGAMVCVLDGDLSKAEPFTIRVKAPAGYVVPPHWHSCDENITVLSGKFSIGDGDQIDKSAATALGPGGFTKMPAKMHHYAYCDEETIFQVHGVGPFDITYINPADDPRTKGSEGTSNK